MAQTGEPLLTPESGWRRFDSADANIVSNTSQTVDANSYGGAYYTLYNKDDYVRFNFTGTKIRLICLMQASQYIGTASAGGDANVVINGQSYTFNTQQADGALVYQTLNFEKTGLQDGEHTIEISNPAGGYYIWFDAVDIGVYDKIALYDPEFKDRKLCESIKELLKETFSPGGRFGFTYAYTAGNCGEFLYTGAPATESEVISAEAGDEITRPFNFVFVGYTPKGAYKFIADRNVQADITWETLNMAGYCTSSGVNKTYSNFSPQVSLRIPHSAATAQGGGEWDAILCDYDLSGTVLDQAAFWHTGESSWTLATPRGNAANRVVRGGASAAEFTELSSAQAAGFRPVLIIDPNPIVAHRPDDETACPLELVTEITAIQPGQAISCEYSAESGKAGVFSNLGRATKPHISDMAPEAPDGTFYFICVGYTPGGNLKLVADRNVQGKIAWDTLSAAGVCTTDGTSGLIAEHPNLYMRLPQTISDARVDLENNYGEWDAIVSTYDLGGLIEPSDNAVWNCKETLSWTLATVKNEPSLRVARGLQDKGDIKSSQKKYDSNTAYEKVGFRPVITLQKGNYYLYLKEDGTCYKVLDNELTKVADDWGALSDADKKSLFAAAGQSIGSMRLLEDLSNFKILMHSDYKDETKPEVSIKAIANPRLLVPKQLINLNGCGINQAKVTAAFQGAGSCKVLVTPDLAAYYTFDFANGEWKVVERRDLAAVAAEGIDTAQLQNINRTQWDQLHSGGLTGIAFAFLPEVDDLGDGYEIAKLELEFGASGRWDRAEYGADYTYSYTGNDTLSVTIKTDGTYKINYYEGAENF